MRPQQPCSRPLRICASAACVVLLAATFPTRAVEPPAPDQWGFVLEPYLWTPSISGTSGTGAPVKITFTDILEDLNLAGMGRLTATRNKFSVFADAIYLKLNTGGDAQAPIPITGSNLPGLLPGAPLAGGGRSVTVSGQTKVVMKTWITSAAAGYELFSTDRASMQAFAGARWLSFDITADVSVTGPRGRVTRGARVSDILNYWDGIVGAMGKYYMDDAKKMYFEYYGDVGTGETDLSWQVQGGLGFRVSENWDLHASYRVLKVNFESGSPIADLKIGGPQFSAKYRF